MYPPGDVAPSAYPVIVKPAREDGSIGIGEDSVARDADGLRRALRALEATRSAAMVQQYVDGREISVAFLGWPKPVALPPGEILFDAPAFAGRPHVLTYASKWDPASEDYAATRSVAAVLSPALLERVSTRAARAARSASDYGRVDFRVDAAGTCAIDANPNCDLSADGGFMRAARRAGLSRTDALMTILAGAFDRAWRAG